MASFKEYNNKTFYIGPEGTTVEGRQTFFYYLIDTQNIL